jgi:hypothetical protein
MISFPYRVRNAFGREIEVWVPHGFTLMLSGHRKRKNYPYNSDVSYVEKIPEEGNQNRQVVPIICILQLYSRLGKHGRCSENEKKKSRKR